MVEILFIRNTVETIIFLLVDMCNSFVLTYISDMMQMLADGYVTLTAFSNSFD